MKTDPYTRAILTLIAAALLYLCVLMTGPSLAAQAGPAAASSSMVAQTKPQPVVLVGWGNVDNDGRVVLSTVRDQSGTIRSDTTFPVTAYSGPQPLAVKMDVTFQQPLPFSVTGIKRVTDWEPIRAEVEPAPTPLKPGRGR